MIVKLANLDLGLRRPTTMGMQNQFTVGVPGTGIPNSAKIQAAAQLNVLNHNKGPQFTPMAHIGSI